jgi:hypothetical protein
MTPKERIEVLEKEVAELKKGIQQNHCPTCKRPFGYWAYPYWSYQPYVQPYTTYTIPTIMDTCITTTDTNAGFAYTLTSGT